ncbi:riboflavin synthase subunit alpha [Psychrosphaera ytuae]|uniref:Riboflavin synthase n=1 Tax=Psychrosphaera ytuae TaxID=2820710 RepID=A0A975DBX1_9GAMM|nr:riboflavin synthase subunit alpha [Psychrosphaera ytuae]QTH64307.1 riboflavin synthase subunit alpha [Psychrosphaera ytuae]
MFTGIVQTKATVVSISGDDSFKTICLSVGREHLERLTIGASIAINGCCLTVTKFETQMNDVVGQVYFDVIDESLQKTNLGKLRQGSLVNFERSVTFGTEIGGHIVSGHIHATAKVIKSESHGSNWIMTLELSPKWMKYVLHKGFVSVNGCSLTVGDVTESTFNLHLIPETMNITNLGEYVPGDEINIEVDQQTYTTVQTVERYLKSINKNLPV